MFELITEVLEDGTSWRIEAQYARKADGEVFPHYLKSNLKDGERGDEADDAYDSAIDGMESLLLALIGQGFSLEDPKIGEAVKTAVQAITNNTLEG